MKLSRRLLLCAALSLTSRIVLAAGWGDFESLRVHATQTGLAPLDAYLQSSQASNDFQLDIDIADPAQPQHGTIMVVDGRVMLIKGLTPSPGSELGTLDRPLLMYALLSSTLSRVLPAGPNATFTAQKISHVDTAAGLSYSTASARGFLPPPWSVEGSLRPTGSLSFDFDLIVKWSMSPSGTRQANAVTLKGALQHQTDFRLDDSMAVTGLAVFRLEDRSGYIATPMSNPPRTIGDIRRELMAPAKPSNPPAKSGAR
jgi:hypothetical protein